MCKCTTYVGKIFLISLNLLCLCVHVGASVEVLVDQSDMLQGIFFQDQEMKDIFSAYPELVCVDATYKLLELRFPVYVILIEDGNGQSEIVAIFLLLEENERSIMLILSSLTIIAGNLFEY